MPSYRFPARWDLSQCGGTTAEGFQCKRKAFLEGRPYLCQHHQPYDGPARVTGVRATQALRELPGGHLVEQVESATYTFAGGSSHTIEGRVQRERECPRCGQRSWERGRAREMHDADGCTGLSELEATLQEALRRGLRDLRST